MWYSTHAKTELPQSPTFLKGGKEQETHGSKWPIGVLKVEQVPASNVPCPGNRASWVLVSSLLFKDCPVLVAVWPSHPASFLLCLGIRVQTAVYILSLLAF